MQNKYFETLIILLVLIVYIYKYGYFYTLTRVCSASARRWEVMGLIIGPNRVIAKDVKIVPTAAM